MFCHELEYVPITFNPHTQQVIWEPLVESELSPSPSERTESGYWAGPGADASCGVSVKSMEAMQTWSVV